MPSEETNVIEAGANGASVAGQTVVAVLVNFLAFLSLLTFINTTLSWLGGRVGYAELSFEVRTPSSLLNILYLPTKHAKKKRVSHTS